MNSEPIDTTEEVSSALSMTTDITYSLHKDENGTPYFTTTWGKRGDVYSNLDDVVADFRKRIEDKMASSDGTRLEVALVFEAAEKHNSASRTNKELTHG